jgi:hypothetical protein
VSVGDGAGATESPKTRSAVLSTSERETFAVSLDAGVALVVAGDVGVALLRVESLVARAAGGAAVAGVGMGSGVVAGAACWQAATAKPAASAAQVMKRVTYSPFWLFAS